MIIATSIGGPLETTRDKAIEALSHGSDLVELRLDLIWDSPPGIETINDLLRGFRDRSIITWRSEGHGGKGRPPDLNWLKSLESVARFIDIEYEFAAMGVRLPNSIVSWHDPSGTPESSKLRYLADRIMELGEISKIVTYARSEEDAYRVLRLYREVRWPGKLIAFSMGRKGSFSRRIAPFLGSPIVYAYLDEPVAEGQISLREALILKELLS